MIPSAEVARLAHQQGVGDRVIEKDYLYDVYRLLESGDVAMDAVPANFATKCQRKGYDPARLGEMITHRVETMGRLWEARLAVQVRDLPHLDEVARAVRRHLRRWGLI